MMKAKALVPKHNRIRRSRGDIVFDIINVIIVVLITLTMIYPMWYVIIVSFATPEEAVMGRLYIWPKTFTLEAYEKVFENKDIWTGYLNTIIYTVAHTLYVLILTVPPAYALSKKQLPGRVAITWYFFATMFISGGMIPFYLLVDGIGLNGSLWALILPYCMSTWNMMVMRSSFRALPESIEESAHIDGASELTILFRIVLPLSVPVLAVMVMFYALNYWNSWFPASLFIRKRDMYPLQLLMREILMMDEDTLNSTVGTGSEINAMGTDEVGAQNYVELLKYTTIVVSTLPIMCVYPFLQKYFVTGILVGSLKE